MARLSLQNVSKWYGLVPALQNISFDVGDRELFVLVGPSGCGKTTLLRLIAGLEDVSDGKILIDQRLVNHDKPKTRNIAMVFQNFALYPHMTVMENMILGSQRRFPAYGGLGISWSAVRSRMQAALNTTFISTAPSLDVPAQTLSGGNLQRVVIARELGRPPKLLIAYYPARGLDVSNAEAMRRLLLQARNDGAGILLVSEDLDELFALSDRLVVMYHGSIVGTFRPQETDAHTVGHLMTGGRGMNEE